MTAGPFAFRLVRLLAAFVVLVGASAALRADPPARVARLNHAEGTVSFAPAGDNEWTEARPNRPLTRGDRLWTDRGSRAEIQVGSSAIRLDGQTRLDLLALDDRSAQLSLTQGTVYVRVRSLPEGENFEIDTPNLAYRAAYPGDYRIDVDPDLGTTRVTIHSGTGTVYGETGQARPLGGGQQVTFRGRALTQLAAQESPPRDAFDRWAAERNRREDQSIAARYVPREVVGYQQLDPHGQWRRDPVFGAVWFPQGTPANWAPYRHGHWEWIAPWGWTWIDDAPWGFAPFHYGRWTQIESRWAWVPGRLSLRPVYAPALVAFIGGAPGSVTWFPLAPGEAWQPPYRASPVYVSSVNRNSPVSATATYAHQRRPEALTAVAAAEFQRGRPASSTWLRVALNVLTNAPIVPPPPMPEHRAVAAREAKPPAPTAAAATPPVRPVNAEIAREPKQATAPGTQSPNRPTPTPAAASAQRPGRDEATARSPAPAAGPLPPPPAALARPPAAEPAAEAAAAPPVRSRAKEPLAAGTAPPRLRRPEVARSTEPRALPSKREAAAGRTANRRREAAARAERGRQEQLAARAGQARREQLARQEQARREAQARRVARARQEEQLRREARASQAEQVRRAANREATLLREQRVQRDEQARRAAQDREQAQRDATQRQQQAATEQVRRDQQVWQQQQQRPRPRPDLRRDWRDEAPARPPEIWQRSIPLLSPGRTS